MGELGAQSAGSDQNREFVELFTKHQKQIFFFILNLVSNHTDAEDLLQQTAVDMWKMFGRYEQKTNFLNWSLAIAKFRVLKFRREQNKKTRILNDILFQKLADDLLKRQDTGDEQVALEGCLKRLDNSERDLLRLHYEDGLTYRAIAEKCHCAERRMYTIMSRIHLALHDCILKTLVLWKGDV